MNGLYAGLSALRASQVGINTSAENLTNASTPGYHRRDLILQERIYRNLDAGTGVDIDTIRRITSTVTEGLITGNISDASFTDAQLQTLDQLETLITPGDGSIHDRLQSFFGAVQDLSSRSDDDATRQLVIEHGTQVAAELNYLAGLTRDLQTGVDRELTAAVDTVNQLSVELTELHEQLQQEVPGTQPSNALLDRYDQVVNELAEYIDVRPDTLNSGHHVVNFANGAGIIGQKAPVLTVSYADGQASVRRVGGDKVLQFKGGRIGGLLSARNESIVDFQSELKQFASDLITAVDSVHSTGIGESGAFDVLTGIRAVKDVDEPLATAGANFPIQEGDLFVYVTDTATGEGVLNQIEIDPETDSLRDIAAKLSSLANVNATVNEDAGTLNIASVPGYKFDFTGRPQTSLENAAITGTSGLSLDGSYSGNNNEVYTFDVPTGGTIGQGSGFTVDVRDQAGDIVVQLDVGAGYEPGSRITIGNGIGISFSAGTLNAGDTTSADIVADADTSGILVGLGLNSFFAGSDAFSIAVNSAVVEDPSLFAGTLTGAPSDSTNVNRLLDARNELVSRNGTRTLEESIGQVTSLIGGKVASTRSILEGLNQIGANLETQRQSVSGVDPNEELVKMLSYQQQFQAATRVISTSDAMFNELMAIV